MQIEELMDQEVQHLSGGELQRVAITMCLGMPADVYLIDEPSAYLDSEQRIVAAKVRGSSVSHLLNQKMGSGLCMKWYVMDVFHAALVKALCQADYNTFKTTDAIGRRSAQSDKDPTAQGLLQYSAEVYNRTATELFPSMVYTRCLSRDCAKTSTPRIPRNA